MEWGPELLPSARLFVGPGNELCGFDRIWVCRWKGRQYIFGRNGDDTQDLVFLTHILGLRDTYVAASTLRRFLRHEELESPIMPSTEYNHTPHPNAALKGDTPLVWIVDFNQNCIFYDRDGMHLVYRFSVPEECPIRLRHFEPYTPTQRPVKYLEYSAKICSQLSAPPNTIPHQLFNLVYRLASDYELNWRAKRLTTERYGLQQLANGILSCFTLNFEIQRSYPPDRQRLGGFSARVNELVRWRAWPCPPVVPTVEWRDIHILFTDRMDEAMMLVIEHFATTGEGGYATVGEWRPRNWRPSTPQHYIVTSIREIQYFKKTRETTSCTPVLSFFNGRDPPSPTGVRWMLNAIHGHAYPLRTRIHALPIELQEIVLDFASNGSEIDRAFYGAVLGVGTPFNWNVGLLPLRLCRSTPDSSKFEHQVLIGKTYLGLSYQADSNHDTTRSAGP